MTAKIYKLERREEFKHEYDEMQACIAIADSVGEARAMAQTYATTTIEEEGQVWVKASQSTCRQVGWGLRNLTPQVLCADVLES